MEINDNRITLDIYRYDDLICHIEQLRTENRFLQNENQNYKNLLDDKDKIIEMLKDVIRGENNE